MPPSSILIATWADGLFSFASGKVDHQFAGQPVRGLASDRQGGIVAIVGGHSLRRRSAEGEWTTVMESEHPLSCCLTLGDGLFVGTDDAHILRIDPDCTQHRLTGFDAVEGRGAWYAGAALIDGKLMGPPLGIRSMTATCDGATLLANVHVGGVPRSVDTGGTWRPTIAIDSDVHQVCAHPTRPDLVIAAAAVGLCVSRDGGATWTIEREGLHASYCSAVAIGRHDIFVAASVDHFAAQGAIYRRPIDEDGPLRLLGGGMPDRIDGIADTNCIATRDSTVAVIDRSGCLHLSQDDGTTWSLPVDDLPVPSGLHIC